MESNGKQQTWLSWNVGNWLHASKKHFPTVFLEGFPQGYFLWFYLQNLGWLNGIMQILHYFASGIYLYDSYFMPILSFTITRHWLWSVLSQNIP